MKKNYQVISRQDRRALAHWLTKNGQGLLPLVELVEGAQIALEELIDVTGRATIEAVLELSALQVAGEPQRGRRDGEVIWHGRQPGQVRLSERKLKVQRIRLRRRGGGMGAEVPVPAYEALKAHDRTGARRLEILLSGVSTRNYAKYCRRWPSRWGFRVRRSAANSSRRARTNSKRCASGASTGWKFLSSISTVFASLGIT